MTWWLLACLWLIWLLFWFVRIIASICEGNKSSTFESNGLSVRDVKYLAYYQRGALLDVINRCFFLILRRLIFVIVGENFLGI